MHPKWVAQLPMLVQQVESDLGLNWFWVTVSYTYRTARTLSNKLRSSIQTHTDLAKCVVWLCSGVPQKTKPNQNVSLSLHSWAANYYFLRPHYY